MQKCGPGNRVSNRRKALILLGASALTPRALLAQSKPATGKVWRVGYLDSGSRQSALDSGRTPAFLQGMKELGYIEGKHFVFEPRFADGRTERLAALAEELVHVHSDIIVARQSIAGRAVQIATTSIPIVVALTPDPVRDGFAVTLAKPGSNITGLSSGAAEIIQKHVELLVTILPRIARIAFLLNPISPGQGALLLSVHVAAQRSGRQVLPVGASNPEDLERGFAFMTRNKADAVIVLADSFFLQQRRQIAEFALKHRLPSSCASLDFADSGVLLVYSANQNDILRRVAIFVDKILKGAKPAELPFELPTRFELVINRKTANALGLTLPQELLLRADRVIE